MISAVPDFHKPGVYLGLAHARYIEDPALGYSALKLLHKNPVEYWEEGPYNPFRPPATDEEKRGFFIGTAYHLMQLEGMDLYDEAYGIIPTLLDHPDAIDGNRNLANELKLRGQRYSGMDRRELAEALRRVAPDLEILYFLEQAFQEQAKRPISRRDDAILRRLHAMAMAAPEEIKLLHGEVTTLREAFTGGLAEVSVFWVDDNDVPMRARFDKLKPNATIDLKTISKWDRDKDFRISLLKEIKHRGYWMQVAHYHEARQKLREFVANGQVYGGTPSELAMLEEIAAADDFAWVWIFAKTAGAPRLKAIPAYTDNLRFARAQQEREEAIGQFIAHRAQFGLENPWIDVEAIWEPDEDEWGQADFI